MWELDYKESWAPNNWCFWTVVLEKTLDSPLDYKEIQPVHPEGNQSWMFIGRTDVEAETPILWSYSKNWFIWEDPDAGKNWRQEEKETTKDEMVGWHHWLNEHQIQCCAWSHKESDMTERLNNNNMIFSSILDCGQRLLYCQSLCEKNSKLEF